MKINVIPEQGRPARVPLQLIRIMKLTAIILTFCLIQVSAATKAQITLNENKAPLQKVLESISTQSGYDFIYSTQDLKDLKTGTIKLINVPIETALQAAFDGQPLQYEIADKTVMVKRKTATTYIDHVNGVIANVDIKGIVIGEGNQPLACVTVTEKGTKNGVMTDPNGRFILTVPDDKAILVFSFVGYESQEISVQNLSFPATIALKVAITNLKEVVVNKGYYDDRKELSTGSVGTLTAADIAKQPVNDPLMALEGRIPGLFVTQTSGVAGGAVNVNIR
ncbi:carboxypeptidase-like regulatory domain-containing protein [Mucilaginibacter sp.]|uniref:STN domain-containing protein n=1 Tax=Mucilaginibacter sp. TaxID=1882438 RepID=UPI003D0DAB75